MTIQTTVIVEFEFRNDAYPSAAVNDQRAFWESRMMSLCLCLATLYARWMMQWLESSPCRNRLDFGFENPLCSHSADDLRSRVGPPRSAPSFVIVLLRPWMVLYILPDGRFLLFCQPFQLTGDLIICVSEVQEVQKFFAESKS